MSPRYKAATPRADCSNPMLRIMRAAGPFNARPAMIGEIAIEVQRLRSIAFRIPGTARIGPMLMIGFEGQKTIAEAVRIAASTPGAGRACSEP